MIKITFIDNTTVTGDTFAKIAKKVKKVDSSLPESVEEYMDTVNHRYDIVNVDLDTSTPRLFFKSLERHGFVKIEEKWGE